ncbi:MAG: hypothetical protein ABI881_14615 [Betaproteobacteria bacterium]
MATNLRALAFYAEPLIDHLRIEQLRGPTSRLRDLGRRETSTDAERFAGVARRKKFKKIARIAATPSIVWLRAHAT